MPDHLQAVVTLADIHQILANLPRNLPEAFDQALYNIADKRYGSSIFKLVATSERPLKLEELRVALTVTPGNLRWDVTKLPSDGLSVVYACGGNLLEVDEERETIHFIHHSALVHLLSPPTLTEVSSLHFRSEEAEEYMGSICVTYLNYSLLDQRVSRPPQELLASQVKEKAVKAVATTSPLVARAMVHFTVGSRRSSRDVNISTLLYNISTKPEADCVRAFLPYASSFGMRHTRVLHPNTTAAAWGLWEILLRGEAQYVEIPWGIDTGPGEILEWAVRHSHGALFLRALHSDRLGIRDFEHVMWLIEESPRDLGIGELWLDDILARYLSYDPERTYVKELLDAGANPVIPHRKTGRLPVDLLLRMGYRCDWGARRIISLAELLGYPGGLPGDTTVGVLASIIRSEKIDVALKLIELGVPTKATRFRGSPLEISIQLGSKPLISKLLELDGCGLLDDELAFESVMEMSDSSVLEEILNRYLQSRDPQDIKNGLLPFLCTAVALCRVDIVSLLLRHGFRTDVSHTGAWHRTISKGLLSHHPNAWEVRSIAQPTSKTPLELARMVHHPQITLLLLQANPKVGDLGLITVEACADLLDMPPSSVEEETRYSAILDELLPKIGPVDKLDIRGNSILHYVAKMGWYDLSYMLGLASMDLEVRTRHDETALFIAMYEFIRYEMKSRLYHTAYPLLEHGANPNVTVRGVHVMQVAVVWESLHAAEILLSRGANPNAEVSSDYLYAPKPEPPPEHHEDTVTHPTEQDGGTIMHLAVRQGNDKLVALLLKFDARLDIRDSWGITPLEAAVETLIQETLPLSPRIINILLDAGASPHVLYRDETSILGAVIEHSANKRGYWRDVFADVAVQLLKHGASPDSRIGQQSLREFTIANLLHHKILSALNTSSEILADTGEHRMGMGSLQGWDLSGPSMRPDGQGGGVRCRGDEGPQGGSVGDVAAPGDVPLLPGQHIGAAGPHRTAVRQLTGGTATILGESRQAEVLDSTLVPEAHWDSRQRGSGRSGQEGGEGRRD